MAIIYKLIPNLLSWFGIVVVLLRGFPTRRAAAAGVGSGGFALGVAGAGLLLGRYPGDFSYGIIRDVIGGCFLVLWGGAITAIYRSTVREFPISWGERLVASPFYAAAVFFVSGLIAGAVCASRLAGANSAPLFFLLLALAGGALALAAFTAEKLLPASITVPQSALMAAVVALLLYSSSSILRLDLFSPLTMKLMKFCHDFVHQFFESMLIPDHLFIRTNIWGYIGILFGNEVGFWGGMIIWFTPVVLILLAISVERLPSVAYIRQGAQRRKLLAAALRTRRLKLIIPVLGVVVLAAAVYKSRFPSTEYWDPKPVTVTANPAGEIVIPKKGEVALDDGQLHKYLFKQGGKEARFFVLMTPSGKLTVDLDACAICKPDGYGQAEGTVICYYCKTLIPLDTVGKPGGCNPVPIPFTEKDDGVHIDGLTLVNTWGSTVQATTRIKGEGK